MISEIRDSIIKAIDQAHSEMASRDYIAWILYLGRADVDLRLTGHHISNCVIDYNEDQFYDETREGFYLRYLNKYYSKEGFSYQGEGGIDNLSIEMMIYCHLWESEYFLKALYRMASILLGNGYIWDNVINKSQKWNYMQEEIISPLLKRRLLIGDVLSKAYCSIFRNAFAHSLYSVNEDTREIYTRTKEGYYKFSFDEFQKKFLYSMMLGNILINSLQFNHDCACEKNSAITEVFTTKDGIPVQIYGKMFKHGDEKIPKFLLVPIKD